MRISDASLAYALLRITFGINFLFHGVSRLLKGTEPFLEHLQGTFQNTVLPTALLPLVATVLPWAEAGLGVLLILGLFRRPAMVGGAVMMMLLTFGICLAQNWTVASEQLIYSLVFFVLLSLVGLDVYALDTWLLPASRRTAPSTLLRTSP